jgi:hypothetical protein
MTKESRFDQDNEISLNFPRRLLFLAKLSVTGG